MATENDTAVWDRLAARKSKRCWQRREAELVRVGVVIEVDVWVISSEWSGWSSLNWSTNAPMAISGLTATSCPGRILSMGSPGQVRPMCLTQPGSVGSFRHFRQPPTLERRVFSASVSSGGERAGELDVEVEAEEEVVRTRGTGWPEAWVLFSVMMLSMLRSGRAITRAGGGQCGSGKGVGTCRYWVRWPSCQQEFELLSRPRRMRRTAAFPASKKESTERDKFIPLSHESRTNLLLEKLPGC